MATSVIAPPITHGQTQSAVGHAYVIKQQELLLAMQDRLAASGLPMLSLQGDLAGSGSDTVRVTDWGTDIGFSKAMTPLAAENDTVLPSPVTLGYEEVAIGSFALAHEESYLEQGLRSQAGPSIDKLIGFVPDSWEATLRDLMCQTGQTIAVAIGSSAAPLGVDDMLALIAAYEEQSGSGRPTLTLHPKQITQLRTALRAEPAFQGVASDFASVQALVEGPSYPNFAGLGVDVLKTPSVGVNGGAYQGFATTPGGIGWVRVSTGGIRPANPQGAILVPEYGLVIEELADGARTTTRAYRATAWIGTGLGSSRVFMHRRVISKE